MSNKSVLEQAAFLFKSQYPSLTAEAIICFLMILDLDDPTVGKVAQAVGMTEPQAYHFISELGSTGAGLIKFVNRGDGANVCELTQAGMQARTSVQTALA
ncbi:hypothetical protein [Kordiimonas marina]|uniref:hypothetical protein n=1 Tax=Kordiimonas marina TaxID=2872312 RepID=UPI001FF0F3F3|nr:hypothetical protein [Kordiimonas marina]MCJ9429696.1 hypothetical protein [Kordiimonas marina]